jgi:predicted ATPase
VPDALRNQDMAINRIKVSNFKSFKELDLKLGNFNVVIGANASGKSNFTQIFKFLKDIQENTLDDAISMHGGLESLRNLRMGSRSDLSMQIEYQPSKHQQNSIQVDREILGERNATYAFSFGVNNVDKKVKIKKDKVTQEFEIHRRKKGELFFGGKALGKVTVSNIGGKAKITLIPPALKERLESGRNTPTFYILGVPDGKIPPRTLLIKLLHSTLRPWGEKPFGDIAGFDIDPHVAKNPVQIMGKAELQENGDNLALVLNKLLENKDKKRMFCNLMKDLLPFFGDIDTEKFAEKSVMIRLRENYYKDDKYLRAYLLSDGTINITALIIAVCFEDKDVVIVEEPERNIHPYLTSRVVEMMKEASQKRQIIVTTHSPEVVKHVGVENLLLVSRDKNGFSTISRPSESKEVKTFLKNELEVDELYVQNLLGDW